MFYAGKCPHCEKTIPSAKIVRAVLLTAAGPCTESGNQRKLM